MSSNTAENADVVTESAVAAAGRLIIGWWRRANGEKSNSRREPSATKGEQQGEPSAKTGEPQGEPRREPSATKGEQQDEPSEDQQSQCGS
jgi:hypothetical protein